MSDDQRPNSQNMLIQECLSRFRQRLEYVLNNDPLDLDYLAYIVTQEKTFMNALENVDQPIDVFEALEELSNLLDQRNKPPIFNSVVKMIGPRGRFSRPSWCFKTYHKGGWKSTTCQLGVFTISDDALDAKVRDIKSRLPHAGYRIVKGCLQAEGHRIQWTRLKASMHRVDTEGILSRLTTLGCVVRRKYSVQGPHFLQHIDTNHKLIRYNIIMYLNTACNNTASTALEFFLDGVRRFGWPYKVRADQGVENVQIAEMMFNVRGTGCGSLISGKSVHNQRIERLWREVWTGVTHVYYDVLHSLEEDGFLNISDSLHLFCAQYTFLPRLKADLAKFSAGWNDHPIRTERSLSPNQLWELGMLQCPIREPDMSEENVAVE
ncbi:hypothetical protein AMECASPLE_024289 [Ameca splendens]|uniref:Integrase core domain-containing protein n=1 Tax=Ameca splendens TaxID=208324 RepID=A0ABV0XHB2_9TELE